MHEVSLVSDLLDQILEEASANKLLFVDEVELDIGVLRQVVPQVMQEAFRAAVINTLAKDSVLIINEIQAKAQCRICHDKFIPEVNNFLCPKCQTADVLVLEGNDIILKSISGKKRSR